MILLTGGRDSRRHLIEVRGRAVWLTFGEFTNSCALVVALLTKPDAACRLGGMDIRRLRLAFDRAMEQEGFGKELIHAASDGEYYLAVEPNQIAVDSSFRALAPRYVDENAQKTILAHLDRHPPTTDH